MNAVEALRARRGRIGKGFRGTIASDQRVQSVPSVFLAKALMASFTSSGVLNLSNTVKRTPSNRASPNQVPSHKYPSRVCLRQEMRFCGNP